jgi:hypothetical protein
MTTKGPQKGISPIIARPQKGISPIIGSVVVHFCSAGWPRRGGPAIGARHACHWPLASAQIARSSSAPPLVRSNMPSHSGPPLRSLPYHDRRNTAISQHNIQPYAHRVRMHRAARQESSASSEGPTDVLRFPRLPSFPSLPWCSKPPISKHKPEQKKRVRNQFSSLPHT